MKKDAGIKAFKGLMRGYEFWHRRLNAQKELLESCYDMLGGVHSPKLDGVTGEHSDYKSDAQLEREEKIRNEIERLEANIKRAQAQCDEMDIILSKIEEPIRKAIIDVYGHNKKMDRIAQEMFLSKTTLWNRIDASIKKALED